MVVYSVAFALHLVKKALDGEILAPHTDNTQANAEIKMSLDFFIGLFLPFYLYFKDCYYYNTNITRKSIACKK